MRGFYVSYRGIVSPAYNRIMAHDSKRANDWDHMGIRAEVFQEPSMENINNSNVDIKDAGD